MLTGQAAEVVVGDAAAQLDGGPQHGVGAGLPPGARRIPARLYSRPEGRHLMIGPRCRIAAGNKEYSRTRQARRRGWRERPRLPLNEQSLPFLLPRAGGCE